ncbi:MAG: electron transport complex subunit E [Candidatus Cellulosilyticum pullistercoris]|uniref:Ion-translocating oxidoreductase complex subunit E n=1 Tax=Candidatus Cellulosilyticum pullistercoris TaxID=2838521 RepID=A0A9E2KB13_9FIRM|nr:electron transport complex subunit E [Candidatus Cellulosilyticum pullistercoris]
MTQLAERLKAGIIKDNPTFVQVLGMCPTLAVTTSAINAIGMGLSTTAVLICSNFAISLIRNLIPSKIRIPSFIVVIASFVTVVEFLLKAYIPALYSSLGLFIPLIVVNCIILGRAEAYASKNKPIASIFDGLGMGLGFTTSLTVIGCIRELLGVGTLFGIQIMPSFYTPATVMILAPGAFFTLGILMAILNSVKANKK